MTQGDDQHRQDDRPGDGRKRAARRSSRASRCGLRSINLNVNRQGFLYNPTNCATQATLSTLTSTEGATQTGLSSPFTVTGCEKLKLAPKFAATTSSKVSRANGTSLATTLTQVPGESNIKSVKVQLPKQLPSRDSTLKQACLAATFEANPDNCPKGANVGTRRSRDADAAGADEGQRLLRLARRRGVP